eukprot:TRINITY_DN3981_c0_g1_i2.p1 TRINITY_DN3981_c0_g1~~TRINITY_DN3981_c0_g1_i2.p1  ORF type:complete len:396 (-),score=47.12 TRINITY_DN3981_c0_g1_i2:120-1307(-)
MFDGGYDFSNLLKTSDATTRGDNSGLSTKDDMSPTFFRCLLTEDERQQRIALDHILQLLEESFYFDNCELVRTHLPRIVMLSTECPVALLRNAFSDFLVKFRPDLDANNIVIPQQAASPSTFFSGPDLFVPVDTSDPTVKSIFLSSFLTTGRVSHLTRILAWHPTYYSNSNQTWQYIMNGNGPLLTPLRIYVAILAASSWNSSYVVQHLETEFLLHQGDPSWLQGIQNAPQKIQNLMEINALLAHQPWLINENHIEKLVKGEDPWTISELVHLFTIVAAARGLASFASSMGIVPEIDQQYIQSTSPQPDQESTATGSTGSTEEMFDLSKLVEQLREDHSFSEDREMSEKEKFAHFSAAETAESNSVTDDQTFVFVFSLRFVLVQLLIFLESVINS